MELSNYLRLIKYRKLLIIFTDYIIKFIILQLLIFVSRYYALHLAFYCAKSGVVNDPKMSD